MQRFLNDPDDIVDETVRGFVKAHRDLVRLDASNSRVVVSTAAPLEGRVGIVTGGGSGHEPAFIGYAGRGMVDAVAVGEIILRLSTQPADSPVNASTPPSRVTPGD